MKKIVSAILLLFILIETHAQTDSIPPAPFERYPTVPPFTLLKTDSTDLTRDNLHKNRPVMIMFFSPDCEHCQHQTKDLLAEIDKFKDVQIVMATYQPMENMQKFYIDFEIARYSNIYMGRDTKFFFPPFYKMRNLPFLALYNKKGNLITTFEGNQKVDTLITSFEKKE